MKKWYMQPYFDRSVWILENFDKLSLSKEETLTLLLIDHYKKNGIEMNYETLCGKLSLNTATLDKILSGLVGKHYLSISSSGKGLSFDIDGIFEFDPSQYEVSQHSSAYDIAADFLGKPLTSLELQKCSDLIEKYGENAFLDAMRMAEAYRKSSLAYVEGILRNEK